MKYTEGQIKAIGGKRFFKKRGKRIALLYALSIAWIPLVYWLLGFPRFWIVATPIGIVTANLMVGYFSARSMFLNQVRENPDILKQ